MKAIQKLSYTMRLSVTIKEYIKKSLSLSEVALTPQKLHTIPGTRCLEGRQSRVGHCGNDQKLVAPRCMM